jgi:hypothetical protein
MFRALASSAGKGQKRENSVEVPVATIRAAVRAYPGRRSKNLPTIRTQDTHPGSHEYDT